MARHLLLLLAAGGNCFLMSSKQHHQSLEKAQAAIDGEHLVGGLHGRLNGH